MRARPSQRTPEPGRGGQAIARLLDVVRRCEAPGPRQRAVHAVARPEDVARPRPPALDAEGQVGLQPDGLIRPGGVGDVTAAVHERPLGGDPAVVEHRLAHELDLHLTRDALGRPHQHVVGIVVGRRSGVRRDLVLPLVGSHGERVTDDDPAALRVPRRGEDVGAGLIGPRRRDVDPERPHAEVPRLAVEQGGEDARRVEAGHAQPADTSVGGDQRAGVAVGQERVVLDRREGRRHRRALLARRWGGGVAHGTNQGVCQRPWPATMSSAADGPQDPFG